MTFVSSGCYHPAMPAPSTYMGQELLACPRMSAAPAPAADFCPVLGVFITEHDLKREEEVSGLEGKKKMEMSFSDFDPPRPI